MDRLSLAERRYLQVVPTPVQSWTEFPDRGLVLWLADDVCPVIEDYCRRPAFREQASWPVRVLVAGAPTAERRCIESVDKALVQCAKALLQVAGRKHSVTQAQSPSWSPVETVEISGAGVRRAIRTPATKDTGPLERFQVEMIARRFWTDLVCPEDYFEPCGGWLEKRHSKRVQPGEFLVSLNPELHPVGDFVTRCLLRRVELLRQVLDQFRVRCLQRAGGKLSEVAGRAWEELEANIRSLRAACQTRLSAQVRDSCVILVQVYAAFHPAPDCRWLSLSESSIASGVLMLRHRLTHARNAEMPERIAAALGDLRRLYVGDTPQAAERDEAIASGGLVVVADPPGVFWEEKKSRPSGVDFHPAGSSSSPWHPREEAWRLVISTTRRLRTPLSLLQPGGFAHACQNR